MTTAETTTDLDFATRYGKWALVTGGSEGVGAAWASAIAARGVNIILVARRKEVLEATASELRAVHGVDVEVLSIDITAPDLVDRLHELTADLEVGLVVHNVGSVERNHSWFLDDPVDVTVKTIEVNCTAPAKLAHAFLPAMKERGRGGFVLIGSMAGMAGQPLEATYSAAKAFSQVFAEALWNENREHGIDVVSVPLGGTKTEALEAKGILAGFDLPTGEEVVAEAIEHLADGPVYVPGDSNRRFFAKVTSMSRRDAAETMAKLAYQWIGK
jgi:short-subunit dehydrogenase